MLCFHQSHTVIIYTPTPHPPVHSLMLLQVLGPGVEMLRLESRDKDTNSSAATDMEEFDLTQNVTSSSPKVGGFRIGLCFFGVSVSIL